MAGAEIPEGFAAIEHTANFGRLTGPFYDRILGGELVRAFRVDERHVNGLMVAHGGMLLTFADIVLGTAVFRASKARAVTMRLVSDFLAPARLGDWVEGQAKVDRQTRTLIYASGALRVGHRPVLTMSGIFHVIAAGPVAAAPAATVD